jgi:long-subunit acyl-CoA synthetase (AMP-forming)
VVEFVRTVLRVQFSVVYACRECGGIAVNERVNRGVMVRVRTANGEISCNGTGEILVWSPRLAVYHHNDTDTTIECDGRRYFRTGDVGQLQTDVQTQQQQLRVIDRVGVLVKDATGEWSSPVAVEMALETSFEQALVYQREGQWVAVLIVHGSDTQPQILAQVALCCSRAGLQRYSPKRIFVERSIRWSVSNGMLTTTMKKNRSKLIAHYNQCEWTQEEGSSNLSSHLDARLLESLRGAFPHLVDIVDGLSFREIGASSVDATVLLGLLKARSDFTTCVFVC